jgi:hypothetical protein
MTTTLAILHAHVIVDQLPADRTAAVTLTIARWALGVGVVTLIAVGCQIWIAASEFGTVRRDFALAQAQFKEFSRRPQLSVSIKLEHVLNDPGILARVMLQNTGDRLSRDVRVDILIEAQHIAAVTGVMLSGMTRNAIELAGTSYHVLGYKFGAGQFDNLLYPNGVIYELVFPTFTLKPDVAKTTLLFRAYDNNFAYPASGYGDITFYEGDGAPK